jgi:hypothetical protein
MIRVRRVLTVLGILFAMLPVVRLAAQDRGHGDEAQRAEEVRDDIRANYSQSSKYSRMNGPAPVIMAISNPNNSPPSAAVAARKVT